MCYFGQGIRRGFLGVMSEIKIYFVPDNFAPLRYYGLAFQGSMDGKKWDNLYVVDSLVHAGWNSFKWERGQEPRYRQYRFFGVNGGACTVGKVLQYGYYVVDPANIINTNVTRLVVPANQCPVKLEVDETDVTYANFSSNVRYDIYRTAVCTDISPRYGSVKGGEVITLTGRNFSSDYRRYSIYFDNVECKPF